MIEHFSNDYASARRRWLDLAASRGLAVESHDHPLRGPAGEVLAIDVVRDGPAEASRVLLTTSAVHGVEGHAGCGIQAALLQMGEQLRDRDDTNTAIVHVHAVNPHGFAHARRVTHENVDLNRNFVDFSKPLPVNADYAEFHPLLLPAVWPASPADNQAMQDRIAALGLRRAQLGVTGGQHTHPDGMFFGGHAPTWSRLAFSQVLRQQTRHCRQLAWLDLHTGLGPSGVGERIFAVNDAGAPLDRARRWWGDQVTSVHTGTSNSVALTGPIQNAVETECPHVEYTGICLEFGTLPLDQMLQALRADHWLYQHPEANEDLALRIHQGMRDAFYTDTDAWRRQVWAQALEATQQALAGLRESVRA